jgi:hypothetical protein
LTREEGFSSALLEVKSFDAGKRNLAAITLMDSGNPEAIAALVEAIEVPAYRGARGTLIYALSGFDCSSRFSQIFRWAIEGGFEASCEALSILRDQGMTPTEVERQELSVLLRQAQDQAQLRDDLRDELMAFI